MESKRAAAYKSVAEVVEEGRDVMRVPKWIVWAWTVVGILGILRFIEVL
jgi:hypothetical protein